MFRKVSYGLAATAAALALGMAGAAQAAPAVHPAGINATVLQTGPSNAGGMSLPQVTCNAGIPAPGTCTESMAGFYTHQFGDLFTQVNADFTLNKAATQGLGVTTLSGGVVVGYIHGAIGIQLCEASDGDAAQLGAVYIGNGLFDIGYSIGDLTGLTGDPCVGGGALNGNVFQPALLNVPEGSNIQAQIQQQGNGVLFTAAYVGGTSSFSKWVSNEDSGEAGFYSEAGAGAQADTTMVSAPAVNDLSDFSSVTATDRSGQTAGFPTWDAVEVQGSQDGAAPPLLTPGSLSTSNSQVCVWVKGHRHYWWSGHGKHRRHHHAWVSGHKSCTSGSDGPSSFSILAGTPVGP